MISRISTFSASQLALSQSLATQAKLADAQNQESSGLKSDSFSGFADSTGNYFSFADQSARLNADVAASQSFGQMLSQAYSTIGSVAELATSMRTAVAAAQNGSDNASLANIADQWRTELTSLLNTKFGDSYLFSGASTQIAPVSLANYDTSTITANAAQTSYYAGASAVQSLTTSSFSTDMPVTAGDSGFEKLFRAASLLSSGSADSSTLGAAYDLLTDAVSEVGSAQALVSSRANAVSAFQTSAAAQASSADDFANDIKGADLAKATLQVTQYQTQLEASYSALTALLKVNLLDYLR